MLPRTDVQPELIAATNAILKRHLGRNFFSNMTIKSKGVYFDEIEDGITLYNPVKLIFYVNYSERVKHLVLKFAPNPSCHKFEKLPPSLKN